MLRRYRFENVFFSIFNRKIVPFFLKDWKSVIWTFSHMVNYRVSLRWTWPAGWREFSVYFHSCRGRSRIFFLEGGALVFCSTSTPINHIVFVVLFLQNTSCIRKPQVISGGGGGGEVRTPCTLHLDPPLKLFTLLRETWNVMKTLFFVERVKFSCISLAEKLHVTFDGMKGISRPSFCLVKNKSFEQDSCSRPSRRSLRCEDLSLGK